MASTEKECAYVKCDNKFYGGKRARYCCDKNGQYQRRINARKQIKKEGIKAKAFNVDKVVIK